MLWFLVLELLDLVFINKQAAFKATLQLFLYNTLQSHYYFYDTTE